MCGICGIATRDGAKPALDEEQLLRMSEALVHRGPDEHGLHWEPDVALAMRRLSIIDLAGSHQPVANEDRTVLAIFNGEIYNYRELRADLSRRGHRLRTDGDGETLVHLYEDHGLQFARELDGIFAIALWDASRRRLVLVRDQMGVKPLYYSLGPGGLSFASEVKALISAGLVFPDLDPLSAELFLALGFVPGPRSLFVGVEKLMPGSLIVWDGAGPVRQRSYDVLLEAATANHAPSCERPCPRQEPATWGEDQARLLELLRAATRRQLVSDVPIGSMLSGGLDSSLITALMAEQGAQPVQTFSIGFTEDADANELGHARRVARRLGTDHHELLTSATEHPDLLDEALWHLEEPIADISFLGFLLLSRLARKSVTVALSGQGADELLGGYRKHQIAALAGAVTGGSGSLRAALRPLASRAPAGSTLQRGLQAIAAGDPVERLLEMSRVLQPADRVALLAPGFRTATIEQELAETIKAHLPLRARGPLGQTLALDARLALVDNMLLYFDKMSMAASLEVRVPFLDRDLVRFCTELPDDRKIWLGRRKELLKRASSGLLDAETIRRRKRGFFHAALGAWLRTHGDALLRETLLDGRALGRGQYNQTAVRSLLSAAGTEGQKGDQRLFCLVLLERWQRIFVDGAMPGRSSPTRAASC